MRVLLPVAVLALLGLGVGAFAFGKPPSTSTPPLVSADALRQHRKQTLHHVKKHQTKHERTRGHAKHHKAKPKPKVVGGNPPSQQLADHPVVVVFLYTPDAVLDGLASAEARAGAEAAGAGFMTVDVLDERAVSALAIDFDVRVTPGVVVFTRGPKVATQIDGYADRATVAQAAQNAVA